MERRGGGAVLAGGEHEEKLARFQRDVGEGPFCGQGGVIGEGPAGEPGLACAAVVELDPVAGLAIVVGKGAAGGLELVDDHVGGLGGQGVFAGGDLFPVPHAVVVGISDYQDPGIPDLRFADKDAEAFANFLRSKAGGSVHSDNLQLLTNAHATAGRIAEALDAIIEKAKKDDLVII